MKNFFKRLRSYSFWVSFAGALIIFLNILSKIFGFSYSSDLVNDLILSFAGILVVFGFVVKDKQNEEGETSEEEKVSDKLTDEFTNKLTDEFTNEIVDKIFEKNTTKIENTEVEKNTGSVNSQPIKAQKNQTENTGMEREESESLEIQNDLTQNKSKAEENKTEIENE